MNEKNINFQKLYLEKKYSKIITEIENLDEKQRAAADSRKMCSFTVTSRAVSIAIISAPKVADSIAFCILLTVQCSSELRFFTPNGTGIPARSSSIIFFI